MFKLPAVSGFKAAPNTRRVPNDASGHPIWHQGIDIDSYIATPWAGLNYRHESLLHVRHESLEGATGTGLTSSIPEEIKAILAMTICLRRRAGAKLGRRKSNRDFDLTRKLRANDPYWWILIGGIHVPGFGTHEPQSEQQATSASPAKQQRWIHRLFDN
ncbi:MULTISPECIES: hypothetical protein [Arthrobacter]|uniref:Uncharacterized protein n=1 Tax=Arthrobacter terricola TaxID=2547396 RepID=A0A4R5K8B1_9MICC|nr:MULTISPECIES: hypothetical protein [Arthrobacter]MBT8163270.1 hypothetical protein [Arthrobacter sp. GN70]TDF91186.1 hypothetical protein E1809_21485 [Arthrobacter terricola]